MKWENIMESKFKWLTDWLIYTRISKEKLLMETFFYYTQWSLSDDNTHDDDDDSQKKSISFPFSWLFLDNVQKCFRCKKICYCFLTVCVLLVWDEKKSFFNHFFPTSMTHVYLMYSLIYSINFIENFCIAIIFFGKHTQSQNCILVNLAWKTKRKEKIL